MASGWVTSALESDDLELVIVLPTLTKQVVSVKVEADQARRVAGTQGDVLKIVVFRDKELSNEYPIDARGYVQIPGLGVIQVAGLDPTEVTDRLKLALVERGFARPEISVQPLIRVSVLGEVRSPNVYPVDPGTSLLQLLTVAGGPTDRAKLRDTRVIRDGHAFKVDMESALEGSAAGRIVLYSNDVIVVGRKKGLTSETLGAGLTAASLVLAILNIAFLVRQN